MLLDADAAPTNRCREPTVRRVTGMVATMARPVVISALGVAQILAWGSSYYLPAVLARPIASDTGWPFAWVVGGLSLGLLVAGMVSPRVGRAVDHYGGRPLLMISAVFLSLGLAGMGLAPSLEFYLVAWLVLGFGMGAGLYDASFAALGRLYGANARRAITALTLWGGFASTVCWPLSALLVDAIGWRGTCFVYAALHVGVVLPLYTFLLPREIPERQNDQSSRLRADRASNFVGVADAQTRLVFLLLATTLTLGAAITTAIAAHLMTILEARDIALGAAVALGALIGPSQVGARIIEMFVSRAHHPYWTLVASTLGMAFGLGALWIELPAISLALVLYGAGVGTSRSRKAPCHWLCSGRRAIRRSWVVWRCRAWSRSRLPHGLVLSRSKSPERRLR